MKLISVKMILEKHNLRVWQLCRAMQCSRSHFYDLAHNNFKGSEPVVRKALSQLVKESD